ncbi:MAG: hypothetical protein MHM6MM_009190 [Cercozoa sp. M6MM]
MFLRLLSVVGLLRLAGAAQYDPYIRQESVCGVDRIIRPAEVKDIEDAIAATRIMRANESH